MMQVEFDETAQRSVSWNKNMISNVSRGCCYFLVSIIFERLATMGGAMLVSGGGIYFIMICKASPGSSELEQYMLLYIEFLRCSVLVWPALHGDSKVKRERISYCDKCWQIRILKRNTCSR